MEDFDDFFEDEEDHVIVILEKRYIRDMKNPFEFYSHQEFRTRYKFTKECVQNIILPAVENRINHVDRRGLPIPALYQLLIALRFYATNSFQLIHGDIINVSQASVNRCIKNISICFAEQVGEFVRFPQNLDETIRQFHSIDHFPGIIGCVDGTHVAIKSPGGNNAETFRNRKGFMSLNIQVIGDPDLKISDIVVRHPGSTHDSTIFERSAVRARLETRQLRGILLGDNGYPCKPYLLTPYIYPNTPAEQRYNVSHKRTRNTVERLFGVWKRKFSCLNSKLRMKLDNTVLTILACAVLHNISIIYNQIEDENDENLPQEMPLQINQMNNMAGLAFRRAFTQQHFQ